LTVQSKTVYKQMIPVSVSLLFFSGSGHVYRWRHALQRNFIHSNL